MATQVSLTDGAVASAGALAIQTNGTTQAVSISTGQVATLAQNPILTSGTANGVAYLNGSKAVTSGSALVFDGTNLGVGTASPSFKLDVSHAVPGMRLNSSQTLSNNLLIQGASSYNYGVVGVQTGNNTSGGDVYMLGYAASAGASATPVACWTSSGNLLVGTTSALGGRVNIASSSSLWGIGIKNSSASSNMLVFLNSSGTAVGSVFSDASSTSYATSSDYRLKNTIAPMVGALDKVAQLKPVTYKWNVDGSDSQGFIAHELAEVCPQAVIGEKDAVDENGNPKYQGIDTSFLVATLTAAIQEQQALITQLTARITALESA